MPNYIKLGLCPFLNKSHHPENATFWLCWDLNQPLLQKDNITFHYHASSSNLKVGLNGFHRKHISNVIGKCTTIPSKVLSWRGAEKQLLVDTHEWQALLASALFPYRGSHSVTFYSFMFGIFQPTPQTLASSYVINTLKFLPAVSISFWKPKLLIVRELLWFSPYFTLKII